ncbi:hypothetical protein [Hyphococcus luteus]|uniref:5-deoxy-glucuronate isomerase n=1 Tax=Hyphococcus luteus TaxID=2058213 RepID=A0A2S7K1N6_9PROT|nr:hypothetical protein [Marinicaulis flavus]PQA86420.1 hypothetical protein CW354_19005 [Marinicaulis flavus]
MYGKNDLRASLVSNKQPEMRTPFQPASYGLFYNEKPVESDENGASWLCRGQTLIVNYIEAKAGGRFTRKNQPDEYALLLPFEGMTVKVTANGEEQTISGPSVVFIPPGESEIETKNDGAIWRLITTQSADLVEKCPNKGDYKEPDPNVAPFEAWPEPVGGHRIRAYSGTVPREEGRFGRLYRGSTVMVNFGDGRVGKRDPKNVSPHHHDDFEQYSIALAGEFTHHLRWPWTHDMTTWREDEHAYCNAPSVCVIPPPATHTSAGMTDGLNRLCDAFCPPRRDFSEREGWVLNADDYPMPDFGD